MDEKLRKAIKAARAGDPAELFKVAQALEQSGAFQALGERPEYPILFPWGAMRIKPYHQTCISIVCDPVTFPWENRLEYYRSYNQGHEHEFNLEDPINIVRENLDEIFPNSTEGQKIWIPYRFNEHTNYVRTLRLAGSLDLDSISNELVILAADIADWVQQHPQEMAKAERDWKFFQVQLEYEQYLSALEKLKPLEMGVRLAVSNWLELL